MRGAASIRRCPFFIIDETNHWIVAQMGSTACAAQVGSLMATYVIETVGTQEYTFTRESFLERLAQNYGDAAAADVAPHVVVS